MDEEGVYRISISGMKEMEKRGGNMVFFLGKKLFLFIQRIGFSLLTPLGFVQYLLEVSCHAS